MLIMLFKVRRLSTTNAKSNISICIHRDAFNVICNSGEHQNYKFRIKNIPRNRHILFFKKLQHPKKIAMHTAKCKKTNKIQEKIS